MIKTPSSNHDATPAHRRAVPVAGAGHDLKSPDFHVGEARYRVFAELRNQEPVYWNEEADGPGFWAVTRFEDVLRVVQDPATFSADVSQGGMRIFNIQDVTPSPRAHLLSLDPPQHTQFRKVLQPLFTTEAVQALLPGIKSRARELVARIAPKGSADFVTEIAEPMTLGLLVDLLDVPSADAPKLLRWSNIFIGDDDAEMQASITQRQQAIAEMDDYFAALLERRRAHPGIDFVSLLDSVRIDGEPLDFEALSVNFGAFVIAGNETTRHAMSGAVAALTAWPEERRKLIDDPSLIPIATKELIRWVTPLMHVRRTAIRDTDLAGQRIARGDKVVVWYSSANRDTAQWSDAMELRLDRYALSAPHHLAFGGGVHHCLGWRYAEVEIAAVLEVLLPVLSDLRLAAPPSALRSNFISGLKRMPVVFSPAAV